MIDTANPVAGLIDQLKEHGWRCEHPDHWHSPVKDGKPVRAKYLTGSLWHFYAAEVYVTDSCEVMLCGDLWRAYGKDLTAEEFLRWLTLPEPAWNAPAKRSLLPGQKSLFGDE
jgi:hypothetical protein